MTDTTTSASAMSVPSTVSSTSSSSSPSTTASSSRLPQTPVKKEATEGSLADSTSSSKKRKINNDDDDDQEDMDDDDCDESSFSSAASPSKPNHTGGRRKASDEERKARLEARQARNRLSAQYSRERKKAYVEQLEGSVNTLKAENTLLRQQREDDLVLRHALDAKLKESQLRVATLESILRTVAPSLVPLLGSSSLSSSSSSSSPSSSSSAFAASSSSTLAPQFDAGLSATLASALMQNNGLVNKEVPLPLTIAAPPSTASSTLSLDTLSHQSSNEGVRLPAADVFTQFDGVAGNQSALAKVGSNVDVNGSSIANQGYPLASQISVPAPEQPSSIAASAHISAPQHPVEAKAAAGVAREAEALLSNFIDLDAKFAYGDATSAPQDQGASTPAASSQPLSVGQDPAAAAGASRSASASAGDFAGLSTASAGPGEGVSGSSSSIIQSSENNNIENGESTIFSTISLSKEQDPQQRFQLLNSPLMPTERNVWELATDAMLQDIYGNKDDIAADNADSSVSASDASSSEMDVLSAGSSPFDLVDLDIEFEEPMQFNIGLGDEDGCHQKADAATLDWPGLMASLVA
ncbi:conserved hypothetical protein [Sporisorium reilianum SRZ2]|uniref:BZIP domain-containing protein n=1 Tax=Sporisorium reilianum (strain SRZ2) TaxID=999809 RepID=E7A2Y9_SPORE|nr:conserved hypothetical protein [Sporisorium reilianum SRZ2]